MDFLGVSFMLKQLYIFIASAFLLVVIFSACSNSECVEGAENVSDSYNNSIDSGESFPSSSKIVDYLPLDDSEYPYAGIPRIVIETENFREIKDRETEIPAKLQIWGEKAPESEVLDLTIRGRGNTTWRFPKKPFAIKFEKKQTFLGMPSAKKWVMLANYKDRTLIRNAFSFEIARQTNQKWVPQGKFADVFLNRVFIGNYYICEKIEVKKNRLDLEDNDFLLELDEAYDGLYKFKTPHKNFPINIKYPKELSKSQYNYIYSYIDTIECILYGNCEQQRIQDYINFYSVASFWIVQELAQNIEASHPKSMYVYKDSVLNYGPLWDFDWGTYTSKKTGLIIKDYLWIDKFRQMKSFKEIVKQEWSQSKELFRKQTLFIDSLVSYIGKSEKKNNERWPITIKEGLVGDEDKDYQTAIQMMKNAYLNRLDELDSLLNDL